RRAAACFIGYHHCQLLHGSVGKEASAACLGSQRIPSVCGAWPFVQAVFQKMLEKPSAMGPRFGSGATCAGGSVRKTVPPAASLASAVSSNWVVIRTSAVAGSIGVSGYTQTSQS